MQFQVRAFDPQQASVIALSVDALDAASAQQQLQAKGLTVLELRAASASAATGGQAAEEGRLLAQELQALVGAGLSLVESLEALHEREAMTARKLLLARLLAALREGQRFSQALRKLPESFSPLLVGIVEAAENTGDLPAALERYLGYEQRVQAVRQRVLSATIYPLLLLAVGGLVTLFLMGYVVPRFAAVYEGSGRALPWGSQLLLSWGQFAGRHALPLGLAVGLLLGAGGWRLRRMRAQADALPLLAWLPGARRWLHQMALTRLYLTLGLLLRGGLPVQAAMSLAGSVLREEDARVAVLRAREQIATGEPLSAALAGQDLCTPIALRFIQAGERSGQLAQMLNQAAAYHDAETSRWVERFTKSFEPLLMMGVGLVIGLIVLLLYMPVFDLAGSLT